MDRTTRLYGCDPDRLPSTYVRETFNDQDGTVRSVWFKTIIFDDWRDTYYILDTDASDDSTLDKCCKGSLRKRTDGEEVNGFDLYDQPQYGAVPPYPDFDALEASLNATELNAAGQYRTGGDNITASSTLQRGCKYPEMACPGNQSDFRIVWLDNGKIDPTDNGCNGGGSPRYYEMGGGGETVKGFGTLIIDGDLCVRGGIEWWGTVLIRGAIKRVNGDVIIHGGLMAKETVESTGNLTVDGGSNIGMGPIGKVAVTRKTWWER